MNGRYLSVIFMYVAAAAATVGCAWAWGPEGRFTVFLISAIAFVFAAVGAVQLDRPPAGKQGEDARG